MNSTCGWFGTVKAAEQCGCWRWVGLFGVWPDATSRCQQVVNWYKQDTTFTLNLLLGCSYTIGSLVNPGQCLLVFVCLFGLNSLTDTWRSGLEILCILMFAFWWCYNIYYLKLVLHLIWLEIFKPAKWFYSLVFVQTTKITTVFY